MEGDVPERGRAGDLRAPDRREAHHRNRIDHPDHRYRHGRVDEVPRRQSRGLVLLRITDRQVEAHHQGTSGAKHFKPLTGVYPAGKWEDFIDNQGTSATSTAPSTADIEAKLRAGAHAGRRSATEIYFEFGSDPLTTIKGHGSKTVNWHVNGQSVPVTLSVNPTISSPGGPSGASVSISYKGKVVFSKLI